MRDGGKGDKQINPTDKEQFDKNWDTIFKGQPMTTFTTQDREDAQRAPLSQEKIYEILNLLTANISDMWKTGEAKNTFIVEFARAVEQAHGIGITHYESEYLKNVKLAAQAGEQG
jgi:hypothetical protein